jgi:hypothetical protein
MTYLTVVGVGFLIGPGLNTGVSVDKLSGALRQTNNYVMLEETFVDGGKSYLCVHGGHMQQEQCLKPAG